jgi:type 2 lantibiotic biosynthesis protein LanM
MYISERLDNLGNSGASGIPDVLGTDRYRAAAQVRMKQWLEVSGFASEDRFNDRILLLGMRDIAQFEELLGIDPSTLAGEPPGWVTDMLSAYEGRPTIEGGADLFQGEVDHELLPWQRDLNAVAEPIFARKIQEYGTDVLRDAAAKGRRGDVELILASRPKAIFRYLAGVFVLRMHIAELRSPQAKDFAMHVEDFIARENFCGILARYPVLARVLCEFADRWVRAEVLLARRYLADINQIAELCGVDPASFILSSVSPCLGDPHNGFQTVHMLTSSAGARVVYKPTECRIFEHLGNFLDWINAEDHRLTFSIPAAVVRDGYGWVEYVERSPCLSETDFPAFYVRMGSMIAISWIFSSTDMHSENMIPCGDRPTLLDLETVLGCATEEVPVPGPQGQDPLFHNMMKSSVMRSGMLPAFTVPDGQNAVDTTALGARSGQHVTLDTWSDGGTVNMRKHRTEFEHDVIACAPYISDASQGRAEDFVDEIEDGFRRTCELILAKREHLLSEGSPLFGFRECSQRIIFKNTSFYARLSFRLNHPDLLMDAIDRDRYLDHIFAGADGDREFGQICRAERAALDRSDIPYFSFDCDSKSLISDDSTLIENYFDSTPFDALIKRVTAASSEEIWRQSWYVRMSLEALRLNRSDNPAGIAVACCSNPEDGPAPSSVVSKAVRLVTDKVVALGFDGGADGIKWPTVDSSKGRDWQISSGGNSLYAGTMGIALFLAHAGRSLADPVVTSLARRSIGSPIREILTADFASGPMIGAHSGSAGYLYGLTCLSKIWNEDYSNLQEKLLCHIRDNAADDQFLDILGGSAGAGLVIANCFPYLQNRDLALEAARACADRLLDSRSDLGGRVVVPVTEGKPLLTGFSHGAAGLSLACLRLGSLLADSSVAELSVVARDFEARHFSEAGGGWADLRPDAHHSTSPLSTWCNGAAGIGLSRCLAFWSEGNDQPDAARMMDDIGFALRSSRASGLGNSHCLCHGDLGTMELYMAASRLDGMADESKYGQQIAGMVARQVLIGDPACGVAPGVSVPGLMTGQAGIGFGLLRSLDFDMPNVLALTV